MLREATANGERLSAAMASLLIARQRHGQVASKDATIIVGSATGPPSWQRTETKRNDSLVAQLRRQPPRKIEGVGTVRALQVPIDVQRVVDRRQ